MIIFSETSSRLPQTCSNRGPVNSCSAQSSQRKLGYIYEVDPIDPQRVCYNHGVNSMCRGVKKKPSAWLTHVKVKPDG